MPERLRTDEIPIASVNPPSLDPTTATKVRQRTPDDDASNVLGGILVVGMATVGLMALMYVLVTSL